MKERLGSEVKPLAGSVPGTVEPYRADAWPAAFGAAPHADGFAPVT